MTTVLSYHINLFLFPVFSYFLVFVLMVIK